MNENVIYNRKFKNMLAVKDENGENKLLPVINITELAKLMQFGQMAFYFSLLNTCRKWDSLNKSFSAENTSLIASKAEISRNDIERLRSSIFENENPDTMELMCSISPVKNKMIRMNFLDTDYVGVKFEGDVLWWLCQGTYRLKKFPKNNGFPILINAKWCNISKNIMDFFSKIKIANGDKKYTKDDFDFLNIFFESSEPEYNIPTDKNGYLTISDNDDIHKLNDAGKKILEVSINKLKIEDRVSIKAIEDELISMAEYFSTPGVDGQFKESEKVNYIDEIKLQLCGRFDRIGLNSSILGKDLLPNEAYDYANSGHIYYFMLYIYTCLLPYVLEIFEKGVKATLKKRKLVIDRVLKIINDFRKKSLLKKYSSLKSIASAICDPEMFKFFNSETFEDFAEKINDMAMIFHNAMFAGEVKTVTRQAGTHYQITQFDFVCLDLRERTYADGFWLNGNFAVPITKLFKHYKIEANLPELISDGNQQIPDKFEWFKFPCKISELRCSELNELEPEQVVENIKIFSNFQISQFGIKNIINVFECVCAPQNNYTENDKQNVFLKFFENTNGLIIYLSAEQILNWQNYIPTLNLENCRYGLIKDKMIILAGYINENKFSPEYEKAFFISLSRRYDRIDIYKVILPKKIIDNQDSINFSNLFNIDEYSQCKSFIDEDFQANFFRYLHENLNDEDAKKFITKKYISDLFFINSNMKINEIYNLFYTDNDDNLKDKFFPKYKAKELIIFMEENNIPKDISQRLKIYTSQKYLFNEFLNYIFGKEEDEQLLNIVVNKMNAEPELISWLSCEQILKFVNFCSVVMQKTESNRFFELCKMYSKDYELFMHFGKNISAFPKNLLKVFPRLTNFLSAEQIWNLRENITFDKNFNKFLDLMKYVFDENKDINFLKDILRQTPSLIKKIDTFCRIFNEKEFKNLDVKFKYLCKLMLDNNGNFDEDFVSIIKSNINLNSFYNVFYMIEFIYGIDNIPNDYKTVLVHFTNDFNCNFYVTVICLSFLEFCYNYTECNEENFVAVLKKLISYYPDSLKYFFSDDENERLNFKNIHFHYIRHFTESKSTKSFVLYCREKINNDITINLSVRQIFALWEIGKNNELNKILMNLFLDANANDEYFYIITEYKKNILKDMLRHDNDNRLLKKLAKTGSYGILSGFTSEQFVIANEEIAEFWICSKQTNDLIDYILDKELEITFSFLDKIFHIVSINKFDYDEFKIKNLIDSCHEFDVKNRLFQKYRYALNFFEPQQIVILNEKISESDFVDYIGPNKIKDLIAYILDNNLEIDISFLKKIFFGVFRFDGFVDNLHCERSKIGKLFHLCNCTKNEKIFCLQYKYAQLSWGFRQRSFVKRFFEPSLEFGGIFISEFFEKFPEAKKNYLKDIEYENKPKLIGLICSLPSIVTSAIMFTILALGFVSLGVGLGVGISAAVIGLPLLIYNLVPLIKNGIKKWKINHFSSNNQNLSPESPTQSRQPRNNIMNQERNRTDRPPTTQPPRVPSI